MSLPLLPSAAEDTAPLLDALTRVAETSLFAFVDVAEGDWFTAAAGEVAGGWMAVEIGFAGPTAGTFRLALPTAAAGRLGAAFAGDEAPGGLSDAEVRDFAGELANMTCGAWLTATARHVTFDLTAPRVVAGAAPPAARAGAAIVFASLDGAPVRLDVASTPAPAPASD